MRKTQFLNRLLGGIPLDVFFRRYWQRRPLFIKNALDSARFCVDAKGLFELASQENVESRLVQKRRSQWHLTHGPFTHLPREKRDWTLLVQGVNLHRDDANALLGAFRFLPQARLDDLMISYAAPGGGVGPHFDSYDVFLLQAQGTRRWSISSQKKLSLIEGLPLKILADFQPEEEFLCEPGDLLYLPPRYAHDGVALDECMTYSIGFRAPSHQELVGEFYARWTEQLDLSGLYSDALATTCRRPGEIPKLMFEKTQQLVGKIRPTAKDVTLFLGEYLSEPKAHIFFDAQNSQPATFRKNVFKQGLRLDRRSIMLYQGRCIFLNGDSFFADGSDRRHLTTLADQRWLPASLCQIASPPLLTQLYRWYQHGWLRSGSDGV